jgi:hypothetical protein
MQYPAAMFIESAVDMLKSGAVPPEGRAIQIKELTCATGNNDPRFAAGYELGLQTARVVISESPALLMKGVLTRDVL